MEASEMLKIRKVIRTIILLSVLTMVILIGNSAYAENSLSNYGSKRTKYFPEGDYYNFISQWYGKYLDALNEPSIYKYINQRDKKIFRFLWLRTFHNPIAIRLEIIKNERAGILHVKMTDGKGGYEPGKIKEDYTKNISKDHIDKFLKLLESDNFWQLPIKDDGLGFDGAQWIVEGLYNGKYHMVDRWSPKEGAARNIGLFLLDLSGLRKQRGQSDFY